MANQSEYLLNYAIETEEAKRFWQSKHRLNKIKAIIAFSTDLENANLNLMRFGYYNVYRKKYLELYKDFINHPDMGGIPFSDLNELWYEPEPFTGHLKPVYKPPFVIIPVTGDESKVDQWANGQQVVNLKIGELLTGYAELLFEDGTNSHSQNNTFTVSNDYDFKIANVTIAGYQMVIRGKSVGTTSFTLTNIDGKLNTKIVVNVT